MQGEILKMIIMVWWYSHLWASPEPHRKVWCAFFCLPLCRSQKAAKEFSFPLAGSPSTFLIEQRFMLNQRNTTVKFTPFRGVLENQVRGCERALERTEWNEIAFGYLEWKSKIGSCKYTITTSVYLQYTARIKPHQSWPDLLDPMSSATKFHIENWEANRSGRNHQITAIFNLGKKKSCQRQIKYQFSK